MSENGGCAIPSNYMEQAEEWEREGLLDPAWEKQQKKTFTAWCNSHLRKVDTQIDVIERDFEDGLKLMTLLEVISGEQLLRPEKGKMRFHKIANVNKVLQFIESKGVKLVSIGAEEIVDGNLKMTLGMIWTIILRFAIQDISVEEMTAKEGLLLWCQKKTAPYKNVNVQNFHLSFKDGLAFCALIHRHRPDLIDYSKLSRENPSDNLNLAFEVAEKHLNIPRMLDTEDMITSVKPDERCVMAYVSSYYHAFSGAQQAEVASNRICKVLKINQENEKLMQEYEDLASNLLEWIEQMRPQLENRMSMSTLQLAQRKLEEFRDYRGVQKPPKLEEKARLDTTFNNLQTRLRLSNRPAYLPTQGKLILDISSGWKNLENAEKGFEEWLLSELQRLQRLDHLAEKFKHKCDNHEEWMKGKESSMKTEDYKLCSLNELKALKKKHEAFQSDLSAHNERTAEISTIARELNSLGYFDAKCVNERESNILLDWQTLTDLTENRKTLIEDAEQQLEAIDLLHLEFAKKAALFNNWMDGVKDDLIDMFIVHSTQEIEELMDVHEQFKATLSDAGAGFESICKLAYEVEEIKDKHNLICKVDNQYTALSVEELSQRWMELQGLIPARDAVLERELEKQQKNERLRQEFASKANTFGKWIEEQLDKVANMTLGRGSVLEDHLEAMKDLEKSTAECREDFNELESINHEMQEAMVFENQHTSYSMETLRVGWESLQTSIVRNINEIENQILTRDSKGITNEQLAEYQKSFKHFDKSKNNLLEPKEFKACLISIGCNIRDDKQGDADFQRIMSVVDPNHQNAVTFEAFIDFMTRESTDRDTSEQVMQSFRILAGDLPYITDDVLQRELPATQAEYCIARMPTFGGQNVPDGARDYSRFSTSLYRETDL